MSQAKRRAFLLGGAAAGTAALAPGMAARAGALTPLLDTYVAGTGYHDARQAEAELRAGDRLVLTRAPENGYDPRCIDVWTRSGAKLGCVPRVENQALSRLMDAGLGPEAEVTSVRFDQAKPDIRLRISVPLAI